MKINSLEVSEEMDEMKISVTFYMSTFFSSSPRGQTLRRISTRDRPSSNTRTHASRNMLLF